MEKINIILTNEVRNIILETCKKSGKREIVGMLFAQHFSTNEFKVLEVTVAMEYLGTMSRFIRGIVSGLRQLAKFYKYHNYFYSKYNYLGDWHSHPNFKFYPSATDDASMFKLLYDVEVGAYFLVLLIVKIKNNQLKVNGWAYFPGNKRVKCEIKLES